ncbi:sperm acrosome-associated protein 9 [Arapaima gigas]
MDGVKDKLRVIQHKVKIFKQQQFIFIAALERSRDHAHHKTQAVSTVAQVRAYMDHHCSNATDHRIFSLFLEIVGDLDELLRLLVAQGKQSAGCSLEACKALLRPGFDLSKLRASYLHDEVNRLSCNEARNYYGGVVSLIPLALEHLTKAASSSTIQNWDAVHESTSKSATLKTASQQHSESSQIDRCSDGAKSTCSKWDHSKKVVAQGLRRWNAGKPAWRPPGRMRI